MDQIAGIGNYEGNKEIDAKGKYICPGLIDSHVHIESTMVTPAEFAKAVIPFGTTTVIADPHEIANVCGINGLDFMLDQSKFLPINIFFMIPSCVPATSFENNGAVLSSELITPFASKDRILGLGEVMDYPSVLNGNEDMLNKIGLFCDKIVDGHSPNLAGKELNAYMAAGVLSDYECSTVEEALERLRLGMSIQVREGSGAKNLETLIKGLLEKRQNFNRCLFCTDDKHLEDIKKEGHISYNVKKAIALGVDPIEAISMATINAALFYKLKKLGAIGPGYYADLIILDNLKDFKINKVFHRGKVILKKRRYVRAFSEILF
jgi:adenine deaminase